MKIGILTQPLSHNYGGIIQNYALQYVLKEAGMQVETINHHIKPNPSLKNRVLGIVELLKGFLNNYTDTNYILTKEEKDIIEKNLSYFINKYILLSSQINTIKEFSVNDSIQQYDAYIVGSDQCWRPRYNKGYLNSMYLDFLKRDVKRIAYAVSFGADVWEYSTDQTKVCSGLAKKFNLITVREDSGISLCGQFLGVPSKQVLDPTLLLTKDHYISLIEKEGESPSKGTLFNYILDPTSEKTLFIKKIENEAQLLSFQVLPKYHSSKRTKEIVKKKIEDCIYPSVTSWLRAFMDAEMVVVDSFHGMVFSIVFNKPFWVIGNKSRGLSRFMSLLRMLKLEDRLIEETMLSTTNIFKPIDWNMVNEVITEKKNESICLLLNTLRDA